jgi:hypothetical protein
MKRVLISGLLMAVASVVAILVSIVPAGTHRSEAGAGVAVKNLPGCSTNNIPANDDGSTDAVALPFTLDFFGTSYSSLYVNNNGNVTFDDDLFTFTPFSLLSTSRVIIAPFFGDVDTRGVGSGLVTYGSTSFSGRAAFCVNWPGVGYYSQAVNKLNSFQLLLVDRSDAGVGDFDIIFNYNQIEWETGDASGGVNGLGGSSARAGYSNGSDVSLELNGSAINGAFLDSSPSGLVYGNRNSNLPGRYVFNVRNGQAPAGGAISGRIFGDPAGAPISGSPAGAGVALAGAIVQLCPNGAPPCLRTTSREDGTYIFEGLPSGAYNAAAWPPAGWDLFPGTRGPIIVNAPGTTADQDMFLGHPGPLPNNVSIATIATTPSGAPVITWGASVPFSVTNCTGGLSATWSLEKDGATIQSGSLTESPPGTYSGKIMPLSPQHGPAILHINIDCPSGPDKDLDIDVYIDPSGTVIDTHGAPIEGATVTLLDAESAIGPFVAVPNGSAVMSPSNRTNPDTTEADGVFHWDVVAGFYKVRAEKDGCHAPGNEKQLFIETEVLEIPPEVTGLIMTLECPGGGPTNTPAPPTFTPTSQGPQPTPTFTPTSQGPAPTPTRTPTTQPGTPLPPEGDANCNGIVNSIDVAIILQYVAGLIGNIQCFPFADVNDDGQVNTIDAALILQYIAGLLNSL